MALGIWLQFSYYCILSFCPFLLHSEIYRCAVYPFFIARPRLLMKCCMAVYVSYNIVSWHSSFTSEKQGLSHDHRYIRKDCDRYVFIVCESTSKRLSVRTHRFMYGKYGLMHVESFLQLAVKRLKLLKDIYKPGK